MAALVDAAAAVVVGGVAVGLSMVGVVASLRIRGDREDEEHHDQNRRSRGSEAKIQELLQSRPVRAALWGGGAGLAVVGRDWRAPGFRVIGLRRVDARTGGPISAWSALIGMLVDQARHAAAGKLFGSRARRAREQITDLGAKAKEIERSHAHDREARQRALTELYKAHAVNPAEGCGRMVAGSILLRLILALAMRDGRTVYDRLTGTVVIVDR